MASSSVPPFDAAECRRLAGELDLPQFRARYPYNFLVTPDTRRAKARAAGDPEEEERILYETAMVDVRAIARALQTAILVPVMKKLGNPFAERISVGRAPNCDLVFRYSHVSKLHAHFLLEAKGMTLVDQRSSNGTFVNGRQLEPSVPHLVRPGDGIRFGSLALDLCDSDEAYARSRLALF
jgi:pSer/pThr/pTyr-binding forkhead associated (FHA) protein